ncbi:MAG TPA: helix-turn-helix transcriptional regulator [Herpetosiphonaceae bacterium]
MTSRDTESQQMLNKTIGAALRDARMARGVTQEELARAFGVDRVTIARYERGTRTISAPALLQMLSFLGQPLPLGHGQRSAVGSPTPRPIRADPALERLVAVLQERPELVATVEELLETLDVLPRS